MGATGNVGSHVVSSLLERGRAVRAVSRRERQWPDGVEGFVGDPSSDHGLDEALQGVDGVFLMKRVRRRGRAARRSAGRARGAAVRQLRGVDNPANALAAMHAKSERAVEASGLRWTFLRPCSLQSNLLRWRDQLAVGEVVKAPFADVATAMIDPADIAEVAALALTTPGHEARAYRLSGPET